MNFLTYEELEILITSIFPSDKALIVSKYLSERIIYNKNNIYVFNGDNITYALREDENIKPIDFVLKMCQIIIESSYKKLTKEQQGLMAMK
jgi:hypothetical protein